LDTSRLLGSTRAWTLASLAYLKLFIFLPLSISPVFSSPPICVVFSAYTTPSIFFYLGFLHSIPYNQFFLCVFSSQLSIFFFLWFSDILHIYPPLDLLHQCQCFLHFVSHTNQFLLCFLHKLIIPRAYRQPRFSWAYRQPWFSWDNHQPRFSWIIYTWFSRITINLLYYIWFLRITINLLYYIWFLRITINLLYYIWFLRITINLLITILGFQGSELALLMKTVLLFSLTRHLQLAAPQPDVHLNLRLVPRVF